MSLLKITKVSDAGERCWGVVLLDDGENPVLRSAKGVSKGDVTSMAKTLKFEGPGAPVSEAGKADPVQPTWVIEKTDQGWAVRFTPVASTYFDLLLKPEAAAEPPKVAVEALVAVKRCLADVEVVWDPPEADPAYEDKVTDETEIEGLPGSGPQIAEAMREKLDQFCHWTFRQIPELEGPVLLILDYSPSAGERPLSIALDHGCGPKCWMTAARTRRIGNVRPPRPYEEYKEFVWAGRQFKPYSIKRLSKSIFCDIEALTDVCRRLYRHAVWE